MSGIRNYAIDLAIWNDQKEPWQIFIHFYPGQ